jgi:hypothetical protein
MIRLVEGLGICFTVVDLLSSYASGHLFISMFLHLVNLFGLVGGGS